MGTLFNQYKSVKHLFDKDNEAGDELPEASLSYHQAELLNQSQKKQKKAVKANLFLKF